MNVNSKTSAWATKQKSLIRKFCKHQSGTTAIEYGLIGALVSVAIVVVMAMISGNLNTLFTTISNAFM